MGAAARTDRQTLTPARITQIITHIHVLAGNVRLPEVCRRTRDAIATTPAPSVAKFYINRYDTVRNQRALLALSVNHRVITADAAQHLIWQCAARGIHQQPVQVLPPHLDGAERKLAGPARALVMYLLEEGHLCPGTYAPLLRNVVQHRDVALAQVLVSVVKAVEIDVVLLAVRLRHLVLVKTLVSQPRRPMRKGQRPAIVICPRLLFAALDRPPIAKYFAAILRELCVR